MHRCVSKIPCGHDQTKKVFSLYDVVVLGVVNETDPDGVFNPATLGRVKELSGFAQTMVDPKDPGKKVVARDVIALGNVEWQNKMVFGMLKSFISSFAVVFVMMIFLFRSFLWGLLAMVPLSVTIASIYGIIGLAGKDYDMPVAILSSLSLGLAFDFAIHFLERARMAYQRVGSWKEAAKEMFSEPARAITRNVIVIAIGFTPLLAAPLVPYQTVGIFMASIMAISGIGTMLLLPALINRFKPWLFKRVKKAGEKA